MNVLVIRFEPFPYGTATAYRAYLFCKMLCELGHNVTVLTPEINAKVDNDILLGNYKIKVLSPKSVEMQSYDKLCKYYLDRNHIDLVFRSTSIKHFFIINRYVKKRRIPVLYDSVEWYEPSNWRFGKVDPRYWIFQYLWHKVFVKGNGLIAISRMIEDYYKKHISNTVRIPTITDCSTDLYKGTLSKPDDTIHFIFSGKLDNGKDRVIDFIKAIDILGKDAARIQLDIYGPSVEDVIYQLGKESDLLEKHKTRIRIHGLISQIEARKHCAESDYCIFFRPNRRSSNAGFPTKLGECMTLGTPAFCNDTGDVSLVVKDKSNGFLIRDCSVDVIADNIRFILSMSHSDRIQMREEARKSAIEFFDYKNYLDVLDKVIIRAKN